MKKWVLVKNLLIVSVLVLIAVCQISCQSGFSGRATLGQLIYTAGYSVENRPIECRVLGTGDDVTMILAAIHGDEQAGTPLCMRLIDYFRQNPEDLKGRKVVLLPMTNPDGVVRNQRHNARGIDLNRNFDSTNRQNTERWGMSGLSEPESRVITQVILDYEPDRIITLHEPLNCIDYDGPYLELAEYLGRYCDLPIDKLGTSPGSLGGYAGLDLGVPLITVEFPDGSSDLDADTLWEKYGRLMRAAVAYPEGL